MTWTTWPGRCAQRKRQQRSAARHALHAAALVHAARAQRRCKPRAACRAAAAHCRAVLAALSGPVAPARARAQCDQDAYACTGQKCSAQSMLFVHSNWAATGLYDKLKQLASRCGVHWLGPWLGLRVKEVPSAASCGMDALVWASCCEGAARQPLGGKLWHGATPPFNIRRPAVQAQAGRPDCGAGADMDHRGHYEAHSTAAEHPGCALWRRWAFTARSGRHTSAARPPSRPRAPLRHCLAAGATLLFGGKPLAHHTIPEVYGAVEPTAVFVPLEQALKPEHFGAVTTEVFGPFQVRAATRGCARCPPVCRLVACTEL